MAPLDLMGSLHDIDPAEPAGPNLEFDPDFAALERLAAGKPEQQYGTTIVAAEEPDWKEVIAAAEALMARTHDLRVMAQLAVARLQREGVPGYASSLGLIQHALESRWETVHPRLDPEDDNDPTLRSNALLTLAEPVRVLRLLRTMPLARSPRAGAVSWRDIAINAGTLDVEGETKLGDAAIGAAFRDTDATALDTLRAALDAAAGAARAISAAFEARAGYGTGPDYTELSKLLADMLRMIAQYAMAAPSEPEIEVPGEAAAPVRAAPVGPGGPPTSRAEALRLLDLVIEYYQRNEPSSPLPLLIARARRLADMGFMDILRDLAPDGITQAQVVAGRTDGE